MNSVLRTTFSSLFILKADPSGASVWSTLVTLLCHDGWQGTVSGPIQAMLWMCPQLKLVCRETPWLAILNTLAVCPVWKDTPVIKRPFVSAMLQVFHKHLFCECVGSGTVCSYCNSKYIISAVYDTWWYWLPYSRVFLLLQVSKFYFLWSWRTWRLIAISKSVLHTWLGYLLNCGHESEVSYTDCRTLIRFTSLVRLFIDLWSWIRGWCHKKS